MSNRVGIQIRMTSILFFLALGAGAANPFQSGTNAELNKQLAHPYVAGITVYASGFAVLVLLQVILRQHLPGLDRLAHVPWWAWTGGLISVLSTMAGLTLAQRLGSGIFTGATLTASLLTSVALDHFGLIGFRQHPASPARLAGCGLMVLGLWLVARF